MDLELESKENKTEIQKTNFTRHHPTFKRSLCLPALDVQGCSCASAFWRLATAGDSQSGVMHVGGLAKTPRKRDEADNLSHRYPFDCALTTPSKFADGTTRDPTAKRGGAWSCGCLPSPSAPYRQPTQRALTQMPGYAVPRRTLDETTRHKGQGIPRRNICVEQSLQKRCRHESQRSHCDLGSWQIQHLFCA